jgi:hypothetical protein
MEQPSVGVRETVGMPRRNLRIVMATGGTPLRGVCEYCNMVLNATRNAIGYASDKEEVRNRFDAHKCKSQDDSQIAVRIVPEPAGFLLFPKTPELSSS